MNIGENIKQRRKALKMSQSQLAEILGVQTSAVSKIERGETTNLKPAQIEALCVLFRCTPSDLYDVRSLQVTSSQPMTADQQKLIAIIPLLDEDQVKLLLDVVKVFHAGL